MTSDNTWWQNRGQLMGDNLLPLTPEQQQQQRECMHDNCVQCGGTGIRKDGMTKVKNGKEGE